jgi:hypothetical protein
MKHSAIAGILLPIGASIGCGSVPESGPDIASTEDVSSTQQALAPNGFTAWTPIPGNVSFSGRPSIQTTYSAANNRSWNICGLNFGAKIFCTNRFIIPGTDSGWAAWSELTPPAGFTFASQPSTAFFQGGSALFSGIAARVSGSSCPNCIYLKVAQSGSSAWHQIPASGIASGFTGDISLVSTGGFLYLFASAGNESFSASYTRNFVQNGYSNAGWQAWQPVPGGGVFKRPITATPIESIGGLIVSGIGMDTGAYTQTFSGSFWDGFWANVGPGGSFKNAITATSFSGFGLDIEVFGMGQNDAIWEGDQNAGFSGWFQISNTTFQHGPNAYSPRPGHVDLVATGNTQQAFVASFDRPVGCADGSVEQTFSGGAVGCAGTVQFPQRANLCGAGSRVCSSGDWVALRNGAAPTHNYWTNDALRYSGAGPNACSVSTTAGNACTTNQPMRVCTANGADPEGNACNWFGCGLGSNTPNQFFGGCNGNVTAGALCCPL